MTSLRFGFFVVVCTSALLWSAFVVAGQWLRFNSYPVIGGIRFQSDITSAETISRTLAAYDRMMRYVPCNLPLHDERLILLAHGLDTAMAADGAVDEDSSLKRMQDALAARLACNPTDGKAWLDWSIITTYREGVTPRSLTAYRMSARVAPGESWLAEKRLMVALKFRDVFDTESLAVARTDLDVLARAHPNRMTAVEQAAQVASADALKALFVASVDTKVAR